MSINVTDHQKSRGNGQKSIWFMFCLWVALFSKQTEMGCDFFEIFTKTGIIFFLTFPDVNSSNFTKRDPEIMYFSGTCHGNKYVTEGLF